MYLKLEGTSSLSAGEAVNDIFKFFLFDQIRGNYLTVQGILILYIIKILIFFSFLDLQLVYIVYNLQEEQDDLTV